MKKMTMLFTLLLFPLLHIHGQWTTPRQVDSTVSTLQHDPLVAVGPNRELVIVCNESSQYGKLLCYKSTDLGATFTRTVIAEGGFQPPWYSWTAGQPASLGFNNAGEAILLSHSIYHDDIASFSDYFICRMKRDSLRFRSVWYARGPGGPLPSTLARPVMFVDDTVLHVLHDVRSSSFDCSFLHTTLTGESLGVAQQDTIVTLPTGYFDADLVRTQGAVHVAISALRFQEERFKLWHMRKHHPDSTFLPLLPVDTNYATSPDIANLGSGAMLLLYAAGNGAPYSDSVLTGRVFTDNSTTLSPPFRLAAKPIRPRVTYSNRPPTMHTMETHHHLVYRSYSSTTPLVAYYQFADVQSPPLDSAFFTGYDYGDLALDSLGGKYLVMIGPDGRVYLSKKDVVSDVQDQGSVPAAFVLEQNYPNPFNPTTSFEFRVPSLEFVPLKVYDVLGREVATLVNEVIEPGVHEVMWDAGTRASGVYFYRLQAGAFVETKKLLLLR